jgi:LPXTG-site transpeptidase (sortase) family protein
MSKITLFKFIFPVVFYFGIVGIGYYSFTLLQLEVNKHVQNRSVVSDNLFGWKFPIAKFPLTGSNGNLVAYSSIRDPGGIPQGLPVRLQIPVIGVDSAIEDAAITPDGRMDVPAGSVNVAWFALGPHPGQVGSAVIGGHFGIEKGVPFVFYNLAKVKTGDKLYIINDNNETLAFIVRRIASFDRNADATTVFTSQDGLAHLNLITCEGVWNKVNGNYPLRLVVFADAAPAEGKITVKKQAEVAKTKQTAPKITPALTQSIKQASAAANFTMTSAKKQPAITARLLIASAQSLYATPLDGIITSLLLIAIGFLTFKLIKQ